MCHNDDLVTKHLDLSHQNCQCKFSIIRVIGVVNVGSPAVFLATKWTKTKTVTL